MSNVNKAGTYVFELTVADEKAQTNSVKVRMHVNPAENKPPVVKLPANQTITLPQNSAVLDGSDSSDDQEITKWTWSKIQ